MSPTHFNGFAPRGENTPLISMGMQPGVCLPHSFPWGKQGVRLPDSFQWLSYQWPEFAFHYNGYTVLLCVSEPHSFQWVCSPGR